MYFATAAGFSAQYGLSPTTPGWIELTRSGLSSSTSVRVSPTTPPLTVVTVVEPGYGRSLAMPPKSTIDASSVRRDAERVDDLGVADELERHQPDGPGDVVVGDGVLVAIDGREDEPADRTDTRPMPRAIAVGSARSKVIAGGRAADLGDRRGDMVRVAPGQDHRLAGRA